MPEIKENVQLLGKRIATVLNVLFWECEAIFFCDSTHMSILQKNERHFLS
jgi:hypothetical protein